MIPEDEYRAICKELQRLGYKSLKEYWLGPHWKKTKDIFKRHRSYQKGCFCCEKTKIKLSLHHMTYVRLGREDFSDCFWVCDDCHYLIHAIGEKHLKNAHIKVRLKHREQREREEKKLAKQLSKRHNKRAASQARAQTYRRRKSGKRHATHSPSNTLKVFYK